MAPPETLESDTLSTATDDHVRELEAEVAKREQTEHEFSDFLEYAVEGIHMVDPDGTILWANRAELELLGYLPDEFIGRPITEFHVDLPVIEDILEKLRRDETLHNHPARMRAKDGSVKHVLLHANAYFAEGVFRYSGCFTRDITHLKENELVQARLAAIVDSSDDAIIGKTLEGIMTSWNKGAERIFGYTAAETVGRPKTMLFPPELYKEEDDILARIRRGIPIEHFETVRVRKDGRQIDVSLTISPIRDSYGTIVGASTIARDVTETKQHQRDLTALNTRLQRAIAETHHRVKNNLQAVVSLLEMQKADAVAGMLPVEALNESLLQIKTIALVHDVLSHEGPISAVDVQLVLGKLVDLLATSLRAGGNPVLVSLDAQSVWLPTQAATALALTVNELISNAYKHGYLLQRKQSNDGICVRLALRDNDVLLEVADSGPGFPPEFNVAAHANLGLALVQSLVENDLQGELAFDTRDTPDGVGGGRVRIRFPIPARNE